MQLAQTSGDLSTGYAPSEKSIGFNEILKNTENQKHAIQNERDAPITATARNLVFTGLSIAGFLLFTMFATQIITGIAAIVLTAVVGIGGFFGIRWLKVMDPLIKQKTKNKRLEWMMEEARNNAVFQLENLIIDKKQRLLYAREARNKMQALVLKMRDNIKPENEGTKNHTKKVQMLEKIEAASVQMDKNIDKGAYAFEEFKKTVADYKDMDKFTNIAGQAWKMFSNSGGNELDEMLSLEAFDAIETDFNEAIISIENSVHDSNIDMGM